MKPAKNFCFETGRREVSENESLVLLSEFCVAGDILPIADLETKKHEALVLACHEKLFNPPTSQDKIRNILTGDCS